MSLVLPPARSPARSGPSPAWSAGMWCDRCRWEHVARSAVTCWCRRVSLVLALQEEEASAQRGPSPGQARGVWSLCLELRGLAGEAVRQGCLERCWKVAWAVYVTPSRHTRSVSAVCGPNGDPELDSLRFGSGSPHDGRASREAFSTCMQIGCCRAPLQHDWNDVGTVCKR